MGEMGQKWVKCRDCGWVWPTTSTAKKARCSRKNCNGYAIELTPEEIDAYNLPSRGGKGFFPKPPEKTKTQPQAPFVAPGDVTATPEDFEVNVEQIQALPTSLPEGDKHEDGDKIEDAGTQQLEILDEKLGQSSEEQSQPAQPTPQTKRAGNILSKIIILVMDVALDKMKKLSLDDQQKGEIDKIMDEIAAEEEWDVPGGPWTELGVKLFFILVKQKKDPSKLTQADIDKLTQKQKDELLGMLVANMPAPSQPQGQVPPPPVQPQTPQVQPDPQPQPEGGKFKGWVK